MTVSEKDTAILDERARRLAQIPPAPARAADVLKVLTFALGTERYALETAHLREVLRLCECTPVPGTPEFLIGVVNVRGQILDLFDLGKFLGVPGGGWRVTGDGWRDQASLAPGGRHPAPTTPDLPATRHPPPATRDDARILVLGGERSEFGILADDVYEVIRLQREQVLPSPEGVAGITREYLRGVTEDALIVLDGAVLLNDSRLFIDQSEARP